MTIIMKSAMSIPLLSITILITTVGFLKVNILFKIKILEYLKFKKSVLIKIL